MTASPLTTNHRGWGKVTILTLPSSPVLSNELKNSRFLRACRREAVDATPIWLMRQAGRYMREYREVRRKVSFLELCKRSDLAAEVTVTAQRRLQTDAAIIFSDILVLLEPMGMQLDYPENGGPRLDNRIRTSADVERLRVVHPQETLGFVYEALRLTRAALPAGMPLIGFAGAPFTLASYMLEGGSSRHYRHTKAFMYNDPQAWHTLMELLSRAVASHLDGQVAAGAQALQVFDSWVGCLSPADYAEYVLPHMRALFGRLHPQVPVIHFGTHTAQLLTLMREAGGTIIGIDHYHDFGRAWAQVGDIAVQGNLDPAALFAERSVLRRKTHDILRQAQGKRGHIFNLGHGILPETPVDNVLALVDMVHAYGH